MNSFAIRCYNEDGAYWLCAFHSLSDDIRDAVTFPTRAAAMRVKRDLYMPCGVRALRRRQAKQIALSKPMLSRKRRRHRDRQHTRRMEQFLSGSGILNPNSVTQYADHEKPRCRPD